MTVRLASTPITWGYVGGNRWGVDLPPRRILEEMHGLGFRASETGVPGFLPDDTNEAASLLQEFEMEVVAGPVSFVAHEKKTVADAFSRVDAAAARLAELGAGVLITVPKPGNHTLGEPLDADDFSQLVASLERIESIASSHGLRQALHPHVGSLVETAADMRRLMDAADIGWCLDTAHLASGSMTTEEFCDLAGDRISHVHLKDLDTRTGKAMVAHEIEFDAAIHAGVFRALGDGDLDLDATLEALPRDVWWVLEQDVAVDEVPAEGDGPVVDARRSLNEVVSRVPQAAQ